MPLTNSGHMISNQTCPLLTAIVFSVTIIVGQTKAEPVSMLPEGITCHTSGSQGCALPWALKSTVISTRTI